MNRHSCTCCNKKRYEKFMLPLPAWIDSNVNGRVWLCKTCITDYMARINMELNTTIKKLSYLNGQKQKYD